MERLSGREVSESRKFRLWAALGLACLTPMRPCGDDQAGSPTRSQISGRRSGWGAQMCNLRVTPRKGRSRPLPVSPLFYLSLPLFLLQRTAMLACLLHRNRAGISDEYWILAECRSLDALLSFPTSSACPDLQSSIKAVTVTMSP